MAELEKLLETLSARLTAVEAERQELRRDLDLARVEFARLSRLIRDMEAEIARLKAAGIKAYHQKPTDNLPLERGWITKGDGHGTIVELCPKGEVSLFVTGKAG